MIYNVKIVQLLLFSPPFMLMYEGHRTVLHSIGPGSAFFPYDMAA